MAVTTTDSTALQARRAEIEADIAFTRDLLAAYEAEQAARLAEAEHAAWVLRLFGLSPAAHTELSAAVAQDAEWVHTNLATPQARRTTTYCHTCYHATPHTVSGRDFTCLTCGQHTTAIGRSTVGITE